MKYIFGYWGHLFEDSRNRESMTRIVVDVERQVILFGQVATDFRNGEPSAWRDMAPAEKTDLQDSLVSANAEALDVPGDYGLDSGDELPDWAPPILSKPVKRRPARDHDAELAPDDLF